MAEAARSPSSERRRAATCRRGGRPADATGRPNSDRPVQPAARRRSWFRRFRGLRGRQRLQELIERAEDRVVLVCGDRIHPAFRTFGERFALSAKFRSGLGRFTRRGCNGRNRLGRSFLRSGRRSRSGSRIVFLRLNKPLVERWVEGTRHADPMLVVDGTAADRDYGAVEQPELGPRRILAPVLVHRSSTDVIERQTRERGRGGIGGGWAGQGTTFRQPG